MGSTVVYNTKNVSWKDFIYRQIEDDRFKIVHYSKVGSVAYLAIKKDNSIVFGCVVWCFVDKGNKGYKLMEESTGPYYYDAPKVLLDKLTPTDSEYAIEWRRKCRDRAAARKVKVGDIIRFADPVRWGNSNEETDFRIIRLTGVRGLVCDSISGKGLVRVSKIDDREKVWI